jgi:hypothetical protein
MWIKGGMIDRKKNKKDIRFLCVWSMNYIIKGNVIKHQYNIIRENSKIKNKEQPGLIKLRKLTRKVWKLRCRIQT